MSIKWFRPSARWMAGIAGIAATSLLAVAPGPATAQTGSGSDQMRFHRVAISDPVAGGLEAISLLVPDGWEAWGGVEWLRAWSRTAHLGTHVADPATGLSIDWLPVQDFIWFESPAGLEAPIGGNYQGKAYVPPIHDPAEFVARFWMPTPLGHLSRATLVSQREVPRIADEFVAGFGGPAQASAWVLRYAFDRDGQPWEQDVAFALLFTDANGIASWYVNFAHTVAGPAGSLDAEQGTISTILASRTTTPQWEATYRLVQQLFYQGIRQQMADTVAFGEALQRYRAEIAALQEQVTAERWASQDRVASFRRDILGGVENFDDPFSGGIVQLPVTWDHYWTNSRGEVLASDDPNLQPSTLDGLDWRRLPPRDR